jgi:hypothetical protein
MSNLLTRPEVALWLNICLRSVDRLRNRGLLPAAKVLSSIRFELEAVEAFLKAQRVTGTGSTSMPRG